MPFVHVLPTAVALASGGLLSAILLLLSRPRIGRIRLQTSSEASLNDQLHDSGTESETVVEPLEGKEDLFMVAKPEDLFDGTPVDEDAFWQQTRLRKIALTVTLALLVACEAITVGILAASTSSPNPIVASALRLALAIYLLLFAAYSITDSEVRAHWAGLIHLSALTAAAVLLLGVSALLPDDAVLAEVLAAAPDLASAIPPLQYTVLGLYLIFLSLVSTIPRGPPLHFPPSHVYSAKTLATSAPTSKENVCGIVQTSVAGFLLFSYTTPVVMLGYTSESLEIRDLPIVPADMRATTIYTIMRRAMQTIRLRRLPLFGSWKPTPGSGWELMYRIMRVNATAFTIQIVLASVSAVLYYAPALFLRQLIGYLEMDPEREDPRWGWVYALGLFLSNSINFLITGQLWGISTTTLQTRLRVQLNTSLFAKTLVRKDVASSSSSSPVSEGATPAASDAGSTKDGKDDKDKKEKEKDGEEAEFSSKAQVVTLMTVDVDRVSEFSWHFFSLIDAPVEIVIGSVFLYNLLGVSSLLGLLVSILFLPLSHMASKIVVYAQDNLMKARDERVALMNELLGAIRMVKFMAWERASEKRVLAVRAKELRFQRLNYIIETAFTFIWLASPVLVTLVSFWHFSVIRGQVLTPSIAFTSVSVFNELRFALSALPETFINMMQSLVSVRRIEKYLSSAEIQPPMSLHKDGNIVLNSATITWPQDRNMGTSATPSIAPTPRGKFSLLDLTLSFPAGELSLICGKLGSGKTLLLLGMLGEADLLAGQIVCPRTPANTLAQASELGSIPDEEWIVQGVVAYVPQSAWLQNASIRDNILFNLPYNEARYQKTLHVCALEADLEILEDGDMAEIGERGVNLSGGQKARISLARAVYSRAAMLLLDDVLSAVDAHTAHHLFKECLKGELMRGRTIILVSHHVQLCLPGASYVVSLENGRLLFSGSPDDFRSSDIMEGLEKANVEEAKKQEVALKEETIEEVADEVAKEEKENEPGPLLDSTTSTAVPNSPSSENKKVAKKGPRKVVEEERRAVGRIGKKIWLLYVHACGNWLYWTLFVIALLVSSAMPVVENAWLRYWSANGMNQDATHSPIFYVGIYGILSLAALIIMSARLLVVYEGSIHASTVLYKRLLEAVLFAKIRFHDTVSRGRLLNRFGKDFEGLDSSLADNFGRTLFYGLNVVTTFITVSYVGGVGFMVAACFLGFLYYQVAKLYGQTARDMRRLDSVTKSPLYTIYGDAISGVGVLRAFGASTKILREMLQLVDTNTNPYYWMWSVNRWLSARFNLLSAAVVGVTALVILLNRNIDASFAGFALAFASNVMNDLLFMVRRFVGLEQSMVALERVNEFSEVDQEPAEFVESRPPASWPAEGNIDVDNLVVRYAPDLPNVLHGLTFSVGAKQKIGVLGRTGCGKSTLALSFFRFVEPYEGKIVIDGIDITKIGLTDLRSRITIIPQDPTIFSGTLRSTLDVFDEYEDQEIFEALRRVHLLPPVDDEPSTSRAGSENGESEVNVNVFKNLESNVAEGGENFSAGEKQLICMARAILRRSKVLLMDEATASVDYQTDELIGKTIRDEFADSTILTIAHRLRTVIDYDKVLVLDQGRIAEFDEPVNLLANPSSMFYALCKSTGKTEFDVLKKMAEDAAVARSVEA
ncbi:multidrug resistance-associated ABC transporter [Dacryopinax primogenitus]|uniref:Multidrug resistance-associated ABC transporter n=1 Tax=Dacryopinax primogenitus (strain DJM 731) TaxID=1858805 RepID=M5FVL0_DACPD|nr:multidrug resistance-associated ABC transporter [Dacryopinax primogenitus]EJU00344.1 multidrug resistance-associated ABC transporter [Dacryopinax primogenitus]